MDNLSPLLTAMDKSSQRGTTRSLDASKKCQFYLPTVELSSKQDPSSCTTDAVPSLEHLFWSSYSSSISFPPKPPSLSPPLLSSTSSQSSCVHDDNDASLTSQQKLSFSSSQKPSSTSSSSSSTSSSLSSPSSPMTIVMSPPVNCRQPCPHFSCKNIISLLTPQSSFRDSFSKSVSAFLCARRQRWAGLETPNAMVVLTLLILSFALCLQSSAVDAHGLCRGIPCANGGRLLVSNSVWGDCRCRCPPRFVGPYCQYQMARKRSAGLVTNRRVGRSQLMESIRQRLINLRNHIDTSEVVGSGSQDDVIGSISSSSRINISRRSSRRSRSRSSRSRSAISSGSSPSDAGSVLGSGGGAGFGNFETGIDALRSNQNRIQRLRRSWFPMIYKR